MLLNLWEFQTYLFIAPNLTMAERSLEINQFSFYIALLVLLPFCIILSNWIYLLTRALVRENSLVLLMPTYDEVLAEE